MTENYVNPDKKMVVIFTHGMGDQSNEPKCSKKYATKFEKSYTKMQNRLEKHFRKFGKNEHGDEEYYLDRIRFTPILWARELQEQQEILKENVVKCKYQIKCKEKKLKYWTWLRCLRKFMIDFLSDAIVYQKTKTSRLMYDNIQKVFLKELKELVDDTSNGVKEDSPLCIIAHSMGSIITENLIYDLQDMKSTGGWENAEITTPIYKLDKGETLEFY
ncbi:MAG: hypothetical protein KAS95_08620, partial [Candidatus Heimdallarchaeota archaeon]|nr:hypothetical protein [Candidatus Heimdallarchaeota archaeon]